LLINIIYVYCIVGGIQRGNAAHIKLYYIYFTDKLISQLTIHYICLHSTSICYI